ncbi:MAG: DoxX family protein [Pseudonocardiaceae bacterium]|nr:DoxX family protein [Pseudonocardiaceae bacterium]
MKLLIPTAEMELMSQGVPVILLRIAGVAEVLGALGLILPAATRIVPMLTPLAASGLVVVMLGATVANIVIGTYLVVIQTVLLGLLAGFVAWARFVSQPVEPRAGAQPQAA